MYFFVSNVDMHRKPRFLGGVYVQAEDQASALSQAATIVRAATDVGNLDQQSTPCPQDFREGLVAKRFEAIGNKLLSRDECQALDEEMIAEAVEHMLAHQEGETPARAS